MRTLFSLFILTAPLTAQLRPTTFAARTAGVISGPGQL